jgi:hypothetical protein
MIKINLHLGVTISADSTSNQGLNIESAHMALRVADYTSGSLTVDPKSTPKVRFLGVNKTIDHTSAAAIKGWEAHVEGRQTGGPQGSFRMVSSEYIID